MREKNGVGLYMHTQWKMKNDYRIFVQCKGLIQLGRRLLHKIEKMKGKRKEKEILFYIFIISQKI